MKYLINLTIEGKVVSTREISVKGQRSVTQLKGLCDDIYFDWVENVVANYPGALVQIESKSPALRVCFVRSKSHKNAAIPSLWDLQLSAGLDGLSQDHKELLDTVARKVVAEVEGGRDRNQKYGDLPLAAMIQAIWAEERLWQFCRQHDANPWTQSCVNLIRTGQIPIEIIEAVLLNGSRLERFYYHNIKVGYRGCLNPDAWEALRNLTELREAA